MEKQRQAFVEKIVSDLHHTVQYLQTRQRCTWECSSMLVGALSRQMWRENLLDITPDGLYLGYSVVSVVKALKRIQTPVWRSSTDPGRNHSCTLRSFLQPVYYTGDDGLPGLSLEEFR